MQIHIYLTRYAHTCSHLLLEIYMCENLCTYCMHVNIDHLCLCTLIYNCVFLSTHMQTWGGAENLFPLQISSSKQKCNFCPFAQNLECFAVPWRMVPILTSVQYIITVIDHLSYLMKNFLPHCLHWIIVLNCHHTPTAAHTALIRHLVW